MLMSQHRKTSTDPNRSLVLKAIKQEVHQKASDLIENILKPKHVQPPPKGHELNYITDITTKWLGSKCYFVSIYCSPGHTPSCRPLRQNSHAWNSSATSSSPFPSNGTRRPSGMIRGFSLD
jgi:hypothetical protein